MTSIKIDIPDHLVTTLKQKAAAEGITLEEWFRRRAYQEARARKGGKYTLAELVAQCEPGAPISVEDREWLDSPASGREAF